MSDAEKVIKTVEEISGPVSIPTIIAAILILFVLFLVFYNKVWPIIKSHTDAKIKSRIETEKSKEQLKEIISKQETHDSQFEEMVSMVKKLSSDVEKVSEQLSDLSGGNRITLSVLLDIIDCMQASTSPDECARRAQGKINAYLGAGRLPLA